MKTTGFKFLSLSLLAFAGLGIEVIYAFLLEPAVYNAQMREWTVMQNIIHFIITCISWGIITAVLVRVSRKRYQYDVFDEKGSMKGWQWIGVAVCIAFMLITSYIDWNGFKVIKEFQYNGWLKFIFQYLYYIFETLLIALIVVFGQKAGELWFKNKKIPYGGITAALTWGLTHMLTKGSLSVGLLSALSGIVFGIVYLLVNKDVRKAVPIMFIMFVL